MGNYPLRPLGEVAENFDRLRVPLSSRERAIRQGDIPYYGAAGILDWIDDSLFDGLHVLIGEDGSVENQAGRAVLQLADGRFWVNNHAHVLRAQSRSDTRYLFYALNTVQIRPYLTGSVQFKLTQRNLNRIPVPFPDEPTRLAIVSVLGALDDKIELNRRMNETLEQLTREMFSDRFLGNRSSNWPRTAISDLCSTQYGYTASSTMEPIGPQLLRVMDINKRPWIQWDSVPYCEIDEDRLPKYRLERGDIVVARMADPGKSAIIEENVEAVFASYLVRLKAQSIQLAYFLYGFLQSSDYREYAEGVIGGSVQKNMNARVIAGAEVRLPPEAELKAHFVAIEPLRACLSHNVRESRTLAELRDSLLPKLISGELRVSSAI